MASKARRASSGGLEANFKTSHPPQFLHQKSHHKKLAECCDCFIRSEWCVVVHPWSLTQTMCFSLSKETFSGSMLKLWGCIANFPKAKGSFGKGNTIRSIEVIPQITNWKEGEHSHKSRHVVKCKSQQTKTSETKQPLRFFFKGAPTKNPSLSLPCKSYDFVSPIFFQSIFFWQTLDFWRWIPKKQKMRKQRRFFYAARSSTRFIKASRSWPGFSHREALIALSLYLIFRIPDSRLKKFPTPFSLVEDDGAFLCYWNPLNDI